MNWEEIIFNTGEEGGDLIFIIIILILTHVTYFSLGAGKESAQNVSNPK
jgi:hypothetical protein